MYAVGRVGTYIAQGVYTVSGPFHPFGGAVDIIVVQQEDGTFKSSPWYVKFGKFQGVLKRREKKVLVAVNDDDANFHMYLDHKGEAYFLKDAQGDNDAAALSPTEAPSSGDEGSSHVLALEYPKGEEGSDAKAEPTKEESEDERGDDLELRFEGRDASKQLIQQSVEERETAALAEREMNPARGTVTNDLEIQQLQGEMELTPNKETPEGATEASELSQQTANNSEMVVHALLNRAVGLESGRKSTPASALVAKAALAALKSATASDDASSAAACSTVKKTASNNGAIIHGLLNQALGLPASDDSGHATALVATAALASLRKAVSNPQSDTTVATPNRGPELVQLLDDNLNPEKTEQQPIPDSPVGELSGEWKEQVHPAETTISNRKTIGSLATGGTSSNDVMLTSSLSSLETLSTLEGEVDESEVSGPSNVETSPCLIQGSIMLEVRKLEVRDDCLVAEVERHEEKGVAESIATKEKQSVGENGACLEESGTVETIVLNRKQTLEKIHAMEESGIVETIVLNRKQAVEKIHDMVEHTVQEGAGGGIGSNDGQKLEVTHDQLVISKGAGGEVSVHVDKRLVENLNDVLMQNDGVARVVANDNSVTTAGMEVAEVSSEKATAVSPEVTAAGKGPVGNSTDTGGQEITPAGKEELVVNLTDVGSPAVTTTAGEELSLLSPVNVSPADVGSPRLKAAIELEMAWRDVIEKAAMTLKGAPYTSSRRGSLSSEKKRSGPPESTYRKPDGIDGLAGQSERKSWGGWFWGGSSAPQPKQSAEQSSLKDTKGVPRESSEDHSNDGLSNQSGMASNIENVKESRTQMKRGVGFYEDSGSKGEAAEEASEGVGGSGTDRLTEVPTEGKVGSGENASRGKLEDQGDSISESKGQQKAQGGPPARRRSLFGLLTRSNTNQSSLSTASSLQSCDSVLEGLKRESSLERAESVVDLLEVKWARGSGASKGLVAIGRSPDSRIISQNREKKAEAGNFEVENAGAALKLVDVVHSSAAVNSQDCAKESTLIDDRRSCLSDTEATGPETVSINRVKQDENASDPVYEQVADCTEVEKAAGQQPGDGGVINELEVENISEPIVPDEGLGELNSSTDAEVVLMSSDGHLITAPLVSVEDAPQSPHELHVKVTLGDVENRRFSGSPKQRAGLSHGKPGLRSVAHDSPRNWEQHMQTGNGLQHSERCSQDFDISSPDGSRREVKANPSSEGLKELAKLVTVDNVGVGQSKVRGSDANDTAVMSSECKYDQLGHISDSGPAIVKEGDDGSSIGRVDSKDFEDMRSMVFDKLDEFNDGDDSVPQPGDLERYYSSKDLTEEDRERAGFKRNMSMYMDAQSGDEDEMENTGSADEDDPDQSLHTSHPIVIPGGLERARNAHFLDDFHILRSSSESLPKAKYFVVNPEVPSPRLLSRSLDSDPLPVASPADRLKLSPASAVIVTPGAPSGSSLNVLESDGNKVPVMEVTTKKVTEHSKEQSKGRDESGMDSRRTAIGNSGTDDRDKSGETGLELSLCRHLLTERMGFEAAAKAFAAEKVTLDDFKMSGSAIAANDKLVVRVGGRYYPWVVAAPVVLGILAFGEVLTAPNEGAIPVEQPVVLFDGKAATSTLTTTSSGGWKLWPFGVMRRPKTPEKGTTAALVPNDALLVATEAALKNSLAMEYLRMNGYYKRPRKVRTNSPSSQQLASLNLREGSNKITFTFVTRVLGKQQVDARIYLWKWNTRIVVSDVDGTITRSDVLGQVMPLVGKDWTQSGVARLFSAIKNNGYELMFLSARAISQAYLTRQFLENIKQDGEGLPDGPVVISPDGLFPSLYREVIRRAPHEFKIACLEDIKSLFPPGSKPFYAGFGNRDTDELSYLKVGISKGKIFIINPKGEVVVNNQVDIKSYTSLHKLVDDMFPAMTFTEQEDYNEWNFWKLPLPDIDDEPSVKSLDNSSSKRGGKSGRLS